LGDAYIEDLYAGRPLSFCSVLLRYMTRLGHLCRVRRFDLIWIEYELFPWMPPWAEMLLDRLKVPYVVDYDDAIFHNYDLHAKLPVRALLGSKIDRVMRYATLVIAGNDYLAGRATRAGARRVELLPSVVDIEKYSASRERTPGGRFTVGWMGSPATASYLHLVHPSLAAVSKGSDARVLLVGSGPVDLKEVPIEIRGWSEETEASDILDFDVGIMPLPDDSWTRGKCGYKLIQYMASRRPVVASPVGINKRIVEHGTNGFLAGTTDDWERAIVTLAREPALREHMGLAGRRAVEPEYSLQVAAPRLAALLRSAVEGRV
jgi:glycosyltransferase involved in cell wall biosynthesis